MTLLKRNSRLFGELEAELVDRHLFITERPAFGKQRAFKIDVACLAPDFSVERQPAKEWLIAFLISAATTALMAYLALQGIAPAINAGLALVAALIATGTALVFRVHSARTLVFATRHSAVPLLRIRPYRKNQADVAQFAEALHTKILEAETKRGLKAEQLRSGEVRTLRRLCGEAILTNAQYEQAKRIVLNLPH